VGTSRARSRHVGSLDGLRALAVLGVVGYHMGLGWCQGGLLGVSLMFVLSGYLITGLLLVEYRETSTFDLKAFWARRLRRLMPQAVVCVVVTAALCTLLNHVLLTKMRGDVIPSLLMFLNWSKIFSNESYFAAAGGPSPLTHYWTLAIEAQFYLAWPPVLLLLMRRRTSSRAIEIGLVAATVASAVGMALAFSPDADPSRAYYGTDTRAFSLLLGCLLAFVWPFDRVSRWSVKGIAALDRRLVEVVASASVAVLVVMMTVTKGYEAFSFRGGTLLYSVVALVAIAALMPEGSVASRVLSLRPLAWVGSRSYAIYLWHYPIIQLMTNRNSTLPTPAWWYVLELAVTLAVAELTYRFVERPLRYGGVVDRLVDDVNAGQHHPLPKREALASWARGHAAVVAGAVAVLAVSLAGLAFVPGVNAVGGGTDDKRVSATSLRKPLANGQYDVTLIGDSVALDAADYLNDAFPHGLVDCKVGRQASEALEVYDGYRDQGVVGDIVVFSIGTNGPLTQEILARMVEDVGSDKKIYFVNNRMPDSFQDENDALLAALPGTYSNVQVIDWYGLSAGHDDWFWPDGTHLKQETDAMQAFTDMVVDAIGYRQLEATPTAYDVTFIGDVISLDAADELATTFPKGLIDCADGRQAKDVPGVYESYDGQGVVGGSVVVCMGYDQPLDASEIGAVVSAVGSGHELWLVNSRSDNPWCASNNAALADAASRDANVHVVDWYSASSGHDDWFVGDGAHLSEAGQAAYAQTVADAMGYSVGTEAAAA
jgi:peptidoglycan/LPS O-acetylase OafA/YrhL